MTLRTILITIVDIFVVLYTYKTLLWLGAHYDLIHVEDATTFPTKYVVIEAGICLTYLLVGRIMFVLKTILSFLLIVMGLYIARWFERKWYEKRYEKDTNRKDSNNF